MEFNKAYSRNEFLSFLRVNFLPEDFKQEIEPKNKPVQFQYTQEVTKLGACETLDLIVYEVRHSSKHDARVGLTKEAFRMLADEFCERALVLFIPEDDDSNYRFSLIEIKLEVSENTSRVGKKYSNPHRYSYYLGKGVPCHTPNNYLKGKRVKDLDDLRHRFSVEVLSDEFFEEFDKLYSSEPYPNCEPGFIEEFEANPEILEPFLDKTQENIDKQKKPMRDYVKKLMGRLVFMQFLQKKGWLGVPADKEGWSDGNEHFLQDVFKTSTHQETFLDDVLEPLFFEYLNTPYEQRKKKYLTIDGKDYKVPYLNGGLFEQTDLDRKPSKFSVPLFQRLFDLFDLYNFTVDENDPDDVQVSVDPEMLGRIFENQLEDNNDKGAFYTPKTVVQYMCRESLTAYLQTNVEDDFEKECIRAFVETHDKEFLSSNQQKEMLAKLKTVSICDPAIGSGAFPVGLLKELFYCRQELEPIASAADTKKQIIQENIYGVDIEQGAVDIARLRFWLSIVVDCERPEPLPNLDYKIVTGNSLLTTFNNAYVDLKEKTVINGRYVTRSSGAAIRMTKKALLAEQRRFYNLNGDEKYRSSIAIKKHILDIIWYRLDYERSARFLANKRELDAFGVKKVEQLPVFGEERQAMLDYCEALQQELEDESKSLKERAEINLPFFDWEIVFSEIFDQSDDERGFDIIIANPPYIRQEKIERSYKRVLCSHYEMVGNGTADILVYFFGLGVKIMKNNGILNFITSNKFLKTKYGRNIRQFFSEEVDVLSFIDFFELPIFNNASTDAGITLLIKRKPKTNTRYYPVKTLKNLNLTQLTNGNYLGVIKNVEEWQFVKNEELSILSKLGKESISLYEFVNGRIYSGIKTGLNPCFMLKPEVRESILSGCETPGEYERTNNIIKKAFRSRDIRKYTYTGPEQWLLFIPWHFPLPFDEAEEMEPKEAIIESEKKMKSEYPSLYRYLCSHKDELAGRNQDETGIRYEWYALQRWGAKYYKEFDEEKLIYIHTAKKHEFYYDTDKHYVNNSCYIIASRSKLLYCFLNSSLFNYFKRIKFVAYGDGAEEGRCKLDGNKMATVPIKANADENPFDVKFGLLQQAIKANNIDKLITLESEIDILVYHLYDLTYDEVLIIDPNPPFTREEYESKQ